MTLVEHIPGYTFHGRKGAVENAFKYTIDYVMLEPEAKSSTPFLFSRNKRNVTSVWDKDHGARDGTPLRPWIDRQLSKSGIDLTGGSVRLFCFPRLFGFAFNPLSIWLCWPFPQGS